MTQIPEILERATTVLRQNGVTEPRREAASLLAFTLKRDRTFLIAHSEYELSETEENSFDKILERRATREPLQYIVGRQEFYKLDFVVTPAVLIPRPETEIIVENAIEILRKIENPRFCEVGSGSGCIVVSILHNVETASAIGLDISAAALEIARKNAVEHSVGERLQLKISDVFSSLAREKFDLIVSNPPYISLSDINDLQFEVKDFEPRDALTDGANGLTIIEKIIESAPLFLKPRGFLLLEIGCDQSRQTGGMFRGDVWEKVEFLPDLQNIPRVIKARRS